MPNKICTQAAHCEVGSDRRSAVVLSVRGSAELRAGCPAAGATGTMLAKLGEALALLGFVLILRRGEFTITNAHPGVEFRALTGRSEASRLEIEEPSNLERLASEIGNITDVIFVCGDRAEWAVAALLEKNLLYPGVRIVRLRHLALRSLNQIGKDIFNLPITKGHNRAEQRQNTERRIQVVAAEVFTQMQ